MTTVEINWFWTPIFVFIIMLASCQDETNTENILKIMCKKDPAICLELKEGNKK